MSSCDRCGGNPCDCCEHLQPPGECVKCVDEVNDMLIERVEKLEARIEELEKHFEPVVITGDSYAPNPTIAFHEPLRERVEVLERHMESIFRDKVPTDYPPDAVNVGPGPHGCAGCGAPGHFSERPTEHDVRYAWLSKEISRPLHWEVRGARVCLECFNKEKR